MTNLKIAFNDIPHSAHTLTSSNTCEEIFNQYNLLSNKKYHYITLTSSATSQQFTFDLGHDGTSDITATSEYFLFNANQIDTSNLTNIKLEASTDGAIWSLIDTVLPAELTTLKGYHETDYLTTFTETSAFRYWRVNQTTSSGALGNWGKFYFGKFLDLGKEPHKIDLTKRDNDSRFITDAGQVRLKKTKIDEREIVITWRGVSDAKLAELELILDEQPEPLVWLYCETDASFFDGIDLVSCNIIDVDVDRETNYNEIKIKFSEAI